MPTGDAPPSTSPAAVPAAAGRSPWSRDPEPIPEPVPAPELPMRDATEAELAAVAAAAALVAALSEQWRRRVTFAVGPVTRTPTVDHKQITVHEQTESLAVRLRHLDGRAAVGVWHRRPGSTGGKRYPWAFDEGWRNPQLGTRCGCEGRPHLGEHAWLRLNAGELRAWAGADDAAAGLLAVAELRLPTPTARCSSCLREVRVTAAGSAYKHKPPAGIALPEGATACPGSGVAPLEVAPAVAA